MRFVAVVCVAIVTLVGGCQTPPPENTAPDQRQAWAIAIHGGAGGLNRDAAPDVVENYLESLRVALQAGRDRLEAGESSLQVVEEVIAILEDDPAFNAGKGAVFNAAGEHELDASIMDGSTLQCGGVAGVRTVKNPIRLARHVMEETKHVLLAGPGAESFADEMGVVRVEPSYFDVPARWESLQRALERDKKRGTVGVVALDQAGHLAAGTSTGGLTAKKFGRVGDSPIIGAGTYANDATCAVSGTGVGEEFIRHSAAYSISATMEHRGWTLQQAVDHLIDETLDEGIGGVIAVDRNGQIAMRYNTISMFRGAADASGRFDVAIWE